MNVSPINLSGKETMPTIKESATQVFNRMMQISKRRTLSDSEREQLTKARQIIRRSKRSNPRNNDSSGVIIYGRVLRIEAQKTQPHRCDSECKRFQHRYFHDFRVKNAKLIGMPDGTLMITT